MKMNTANFLTGSRIVLSFCLLLFKPFTPMFLLVYIACGLTDVLDGFIARKMKMTSNAGARLDSVADVCFLIAVVVQLIPIVVIPVKLMIWILLIALIRLLSIVIAAHKYHTFTILHTYANKCTGLLLYGVPLFLVFIDMKWLAFTVCTVATFAAIEELFIHILSKEWNADIRGIAELL